jgi:hypothetical protein
MDGARAMRISLADLDNDGDLDCVAMSADRDLPFPHAAGTSISSRSPDAPGIASSSDAVMDRRTVRSRC